MPRSSAASALDDGLAWVVKLATDKDIRQAVDDVMNNWAAAGWELVSLNAVPYPWVRGGGGAIVEIDSTIFVRYTMFWRRHADKKDVDAQPS